MPRMHGERIQDYWTRQVSETESRRVTAEYEQRKSAGLVPIERVTPACTCSEFVYPHVHGFTDTQMMLSRRRVSLAKYINVSRSSS